MKWRILTPEEEAALDSQETPPDVLARQEWDKKHPRCDVCGQFMGGTSRFYQDYWGEWDHI